MNKLLVLTKREIKNYSESKNIVLILIFVFFAVGSPMIINLLPEIIKNSGQYNSNIVDILPPITLYNIMNSYVGGLTKLGILAICFILGGAIADERNEGTTALIIMKSVSRKDYFFSKILGISLFIVLISVLSSILLGYTTWVFVPDFNLNYFLKAMLLLLIFNLYIGILSVLLSGVFKKTIVAGGVVFTANIVMMLVSIAIPKSICNYFPSKLTGYAIEVVNGHLSLNEVIPSIIGALGILLVIGAIALKIFNKSEL